MVKDNGMKPDDECDRETLDYWSRHGRRAEYDAAVESIVAAGRQVPDVPWLDRPTTAGWNGERIASNL